MMMTAATGAAATAPARRATAATAAAGALPWPPARPGRAARGDSPCQRRHRRATAVSDASLVPRCACCWRVRTCAHGAPQAGVRRGPRQAQAGTARCCVHMRALLSANLQCAPARAAGNAAARSVLAWCWGAHKRAPPARQRRERHRLQGREPLSRAQGPRARRPRARPAAGDQRRAPRAHRRLEQGDARRRRRRRRRRRTPRRWAPRRRLRAPGRRLRRPGRRPPHGRLRRPADAGRLPGGGACGPAAAARHDAAAVRGRAGAGGGRGPARGARFPPRAHAACRAAHAQSARLWRCPFAPPCRSSGR